MGKRIILCFFILIIVILNTGCAQLKLPERTEIDELFMISVIGIDKGIEDPNNIYMTILAQTTHDSGGTSGGQNGQNSKQPESSIFSREGPTSFNVAREFQTFSDKEMFWGHVDYYIIGEDAAKEGIYKYVDFLVRDHSMRPTSEIFIAKGSTAKEFIEKGSTGSYFISDRLKSDVRNARLYIGAEEIELLEFIKMLYSRNSCTVVPTVYLMTGENEKENGKEVPIDICLDGYAVFKNYKLVNMLDNEMTSSQNFLTDKVSSGVIDVKGPDGAKVSLEIIDSNTNVNSIFKYGQLQGMTVTVKFTTNVVEVHSPSLILNKETLDFLTNEQSKTIKEEIEKTIKFAQQNNIDFINMSNTIETKHPALWKQYKDSWEEIFPLLPINVEVQTKINRTYDIKNPISISEEEYR